ncbi:hypothetical protein LTR37_017238 [Vermiconidia calcicola]|uniref:Uncharacterized protein n=1 Tax=Vermiconidia calcicola TaxID=1690605 RepID=A0ACC3MKL5_9PEZI|nr:hypothetical protein LTR37_017238 [Vermiconidia calcicola]
MESEQTAQHYSLRRVSACPVHESYGYCTTLSCAFAQTAEPPKEGTEIVVTPNISTFWRLSRELRDRVYELLLCPSEKLELSIEGDQLRLRSEFAPRKNFLAITAACKKINVESSIVFLGKNVFHVDVLAFDDVRFDNRPTLSCERLEYHDLSWLEKDAFGSNTASRSNPYGWTNNFKGWLLKMGSVNAAKLRKVEVSLGNWHLLKPSRYDTEIAHALGRVARLFNSTETVCQIHMHIGIPVPSSERCLVDLHLPITDNSRAKHVLKELLDDSFRRLEISNLQDRISSIALSIVERDMPRCRKRLKHLIKGIYEPPPQWTRDDTLELQQLIQNGMLQPSAGDSEQQVAIYESPPRWTKKDTLELQQLVQSGMLQSIAEESEQRAAPHLANNQRPVITASNEKEVSTHSVAETDSLTGTGDSSDWEDVEEDITAPNVAVPIGFTSARAHEYWHQQRAKTPAASSQAPPIPLKSPLRFAGLGSTINTNTSSLTTPAERRISLITTQARRSKAHEPLNLKARGKFSSLWKKAPNSTSIPTSTSTATRTPTPTTIASTTPTKAKPKNIRIGSSVFEIMGTSQ